MTDEWVADMIAAVDAALVARDLRRLNRTAVDCSITGLSIGALVKARLGHQSSDVQNWWMATFNIPDLDEEPAVGPFLQFTFAVEVHPDAEPGVAGMSMAEQDRIMDVLGRYGTLRMSSYDRLERIPDPYGHDDDPWDEVDFDLDDPPPSCSWCGQRQSPFDPSSCPQCGHREEGHDG